MIYFSLNEPDCASSAATNRQAEHSMAGSVHPVVLDTIRQFRLAEQMSDEYLADDEMEPKIAANRRAGLQNLKILQKNPAHFQKCPFNGHKQLETLFVDVSMK